MNSPFVDISMAQRNKLFNLLRAHMYKYKKNQEILGTIKYENIIVIIISGHAQISSTDYNGNEMMVEDLYADDVFGTNISFTSYENCQIYAKEDTEVIVINYQDLLNPEHLKYSYFNLFLRNLFDIINNKYKQTNERVRMLEQKTIRDKLLEYFEIEYKKTYQRTFTLPFNLKGLADYLAINRSAMFRELKNMKDEKFISAKGNRISLLYKKNDIL